MWSERSARSSRAQVACLACAAPATRQSIPASDELPAVRRDARDANRRVRMRCKWCRGSPARTPHLLPQSTRSSWFPPRACTWRATTDVVSGCYALRRTDLGRCASCGADAGDVTRIKAARTNGCARCGDDLSNRLRPHTGGSDFERCGSKSSAAAGERAVMKTRALSAGVL